MLDAARRFPLVHRYNRQFAIAVDFIKQHGRRSEGKHRRLAETGWRHLEDEDINPNGKPKFINNPDSLIVEANSGDGSYDNAKWQEHLEGTTSTR